MSWIWLLQKKKSSEHILRVNFSPNFKSGFLIYD